MTRAKTTKNGQEVPRQPPGTEPGSWPIDPQTRLYMAALVHSSDDAIIGKTPDGIVTLWNPGAERMYGYTAAEMKGQSIKRIVPAGRESEVDEIYARLTNDEIIEPYETVRIRKDGSQVDVFLKVSPIRDPSGNVIGASSVARDITDQVRARREASKLQAASDSRTVVLETAGRVALDILSSRTGVEALTHIAEAARKLAGAQYAALGVAREDGDGLLEFATAGMSSEDESKIGPRPRGTGILGLLLTRTNPLRIDNLGEHPASGGFPPNHPAMSSFLGVPIKRGETVLGSLYLTNKLNGGHFTTEDEIAVEALGAHAAVAIHNLHLLTRQRALVSGLINAQEEERRAIAYDLHDGLTQYVMASHAHFESSRRAYATDRAERASREMDSGLKYLKEAVIESRRLVNGLRLLSLDDLGLSGALEQLFSEEKARAGWSEAAFVHNLANQRYSSSLETTVYRVAQEALTNARKHAEADHVRMMLLVQLGEPRSEPFLQLEVQDWGRGFIPHEMERNYAHVGLQGMFERVRLVGGEYTVESAPGEGTRLCAVFPIDKERED